MRVKRYGLCVVFMLAFALSVAEVTKVPCLIGVNLCLIFMFGVILSGVEVVKVAGFMKVQRPVSCLVYVCIWLFDK